MSPSDDRAFEELMARRGFRIIGSVSPDVDGATEDEVAMLFPGDVKAAIRDFCAAHSSSRTDG